MSPRFLSMLVIVAMLVTCLPASASDLVSPKLLPPASGLRVGIPNQNVAFDSGTGPSERPAPKRHWSKTGKVLTIVGAGLIAGGTAAVVHGQNTTVACGSNSCTQIGWKATGAVWMAGGAALVIVGLTRHTPTNSLV
jgi:hypothetical protein